MRLLASNNNIVNNYIIMQPRKRKRGRIFIKTEPLRRVDRVQNRRIRRIERTMKPELKFSNDVGTGAITLNATPTVTLMDIPTPIEGPILYYCSLGKG